jgi:hypothetical protein
LISCRDLVEAALKLRSLDLDAVDTFSVILAVLSEGVGRVAVSKMLGLTERSVRKVTTLLRNSELSWLSGLLSRVVITRVTAPWLTCQPVLYTGLSSELLEATCKRVVLLRDFIVISSREPSKIEVIGVLRNSELVLPGLVEEYAEPYLKIRELLPSTSGLLVCWRNYRRFFDDSVLLYSLAQLCESQSLVE